MEIILILYLWYLDHQAKKRLERHIKKTSGVQTEANIRAIEYLREDIEPWFKS